MSEFYDIDKSDFTIRRVTKIQRIEHISGPEIVILKRLLNIIMFNVEKDAENYNELWFKNMFISYKLIDKLRYVPVSEPKSLKENTDIRPYISTGSQYIKPTMDIET